MFSMPADVIQKVLDLNSVDEFRSEQRKKEHITSRMLLVLSSMKRGWDLGVLKLDKTELGKPFLKIGDQHKFISFSHSREMVMCATSDTMDIGLDIEHMEREVNPAIVKRILSENEWKLHSDEHPIRLWTMKEAAVKSLGTGLRTNLKELELEKVSDHEFQITLNNREQLRVISFEAKGHFIAVSWPE